MYPWNTRRFLSFRVHLLCGYKAKLYITQWLEKSVYLFSYLTTLTNTANTVAAKKAQVKST